jgi:phage terminase small subunit
MVAREAARREGLVHCLIAKARVDQAERMWQAARATLTELRTLAKEMGLEPPSLLHQEIDAVAALVDA